MCGKCFTFSSSNTIHRLLPCWAARCRTCLNWDKWKTTSPVCSPLNWIQACKIHEKATVWRWFERSRAELERFQTGAAELRSQQEAVGEADGVCLSACVCVWRGLEGGFYGYCIILSSWEQFLICCFLLRGKRLARVGKIMYSCQNNCVVSGCI